MPQTIPLWLEIVMAATAAGGLGASIYGMATQPNTLAEQQKMLKQQQQQTAQQNALQEQKAVQANMANAQAQSGGFLTQPGLANLASVVAGMPGASSDQAGQRALASYFGTAGGTTPATETLAGAAQGMSGSQG